MATITKRVYQSGYVVYRMRIRRKGVPVFCMTFESREEAESWILTHEILYMSNPKKYIERMNKLRLIHHRCSNTDFCISHERWD